jgi:hypothetical protein
MLILERTESLKILIILCKADFAARKHCGGDEVQLLSCVPEIWVAVTHLAGIDLSDPFVNGHSLPLFIESS